VQAGEPEVSEEPQEGGEGWAEDAKEQLANLANLPRRAHSKPWSHTATAAIIAQWIRRPCCTASAICYSWLGSGSLFDGSEGGVGALSQGGFLIDLLLCFTANIAGGTSDAACFTAGFSSSFTTCLSPTRSPAATSSAASA